MVVTEALYIYDEHNNTILEHIYTGRPPSAKVLLSHYLQHAPPRRSLIYVPNVNPPSLAASIVQDRLLFLSPIASDVEPLVVLEFLHRVADALEEFLGGPLLASKIESSYDVVAQIVGEICDSGIPNNVEPNALREVVETPNWMGNLFGGFGLSTTSPALGSTPSLQRPSSPFASASTNSSSNLPTATSDIPWRRSNVRHTSNELYVDIVESLSVKLAPSGRPLSAIASGTILFTAKISGVPDLQLNLTTPSGKNGIKNAMDLPSFHPCVRLARWRERPGEISFVPPDGKFTLAGYECNLLPDIFEPGSEAMSSSRLNLPAAVEILPSLGADGDEVEVRLTLAQIRPAGVNSSATAATTLGRQVGGGRFTSSTTGFNTNNSAVDHGSSLENIIVSIPVSSAVRNVEDLRASIGEASFLASEGIVEWRVSSKDAGLITTRPAVLRYTLKSIHNEAQPPETQLYGLSPGPNVYEYDENAESTNQNSNGQNGYTDNSNTGSAENPNPNRVQQNMSMMPRSATLSFTAPGRLLSGIKVESLTVNTKASKGLGSAITPYKGVKYHTVSCDGIEVRC